MQLMQLQTGLATGPGAGAAYASRPPPEPSADDMNLPRVLGQLNRQQEEMVDQANDLLEQVDDLYDKLQGTKNGGRSRGRRAGPESAISPVEMLQSLQQLVDEHGAMEQESLQKVCALPWLLSALHPGLLSPPPPFFLLSLLSALCGGRLHYGSNRWSI